MVVKVDLKFDTANPEALEYELHMIRYKLEVALQYAKRMAAEFVKVTRENRFINFRRVEVYYTFDTYAKQFNEYHAKLLRRAFWQAVDNFKES